MTVAELIAKLQEFDPNERVCADTDLGACDIGGVSIDEQQWVNGEDQGGPVRMVLLF